MTTEHFTLQGARSSTIAESVGRATMFFTSVSGGLVALGLVATAAHVGTAFYAFGLVLLPTLTFVGVVTFERAVQSGVEDHGYAWAIANASFKKHQRNEGVTEIVKMPNRGHALTIDSGWREGADKSLEFVKRFV